MRRRSPVEPQTDDPFAVPVEIRRIRRANGDRTWFRRGNKGGKITCRARWTCACRTLAGTNENGAVAKKTAKKWPKNGQTRNPQSHRESVVISTRDLIKPGHHASPLYVNAWCFAPLLPPRSLVWFLLPTLPPAPAPPPRPPFLAACCFSLARTRSGSFPWSALDLPDHIDEPLTDPGPRG